MINYALPGMYENAKLNLLFLKYKEDHPHQFYPNVNINAVYGNFQFSIFDGGRVFGEYRHSTKEDIEFLLHEYNSRGISLRQVFTNNQLKPEHYTNCFENLCMSLCENEMNEIVIADEGLKAYIQEHYPKFQFISSTTRCLNKQNTLAVFDKDYKFVCLDYNLNSDRDFLQSLTDAQKQKCELLVNAICPAGCPTRKEHYRLNSIGHLNYGKPYTVSTCGIKGSTLHPDTMYSKNNLDYEDIVQLYEPIGIQYFKLEGRTLSWSENLCNYVRYMVQPKYQLEVINAISSDYTHAFGSGF